MSDPPEGRRRPSIAIVDTVCPRPYALVDLESGSLGGTEATIVRIAEGLDAGVFQHNRDGDDGRYRPLSAVAGADFMIVLRDPKAAVVIAERFPDAHVVVWMHDLVEAGKDRARRLQQANDAMVERRIDVVCVSDFHRGQVVHALRVGGRSASRQPRVLRIYNPLRPGLSAASGDARDPDKLVFFSAPIKGLDFALYLLPEIRRRWPRMTLHVATPTYAEVEAQAIDGLKVLGVLPQRDVLAHVADALCVFAPNIEYPETFGLALAEANTVGTPVLTFAIGAAPEVLARDNPPLVATIAMLFGYRVARKLGRGRRLAGRWTAACGGFAPIFDAIEAFRAGKHDALRANPDFALPVVLHAWRTLVDERAADED